MDKGNWTYRKLGEICDFERGLTYSKNDESPIPTENSVFRSNNVDLDSKQIVLDDLKYLVPDFYIPDSKKVRPNTILICMSNGSMQHVGKVAHIEKKYGSAFGGFMGLLIPKQECLSKYLFYFLNSSTYRHFLISIANGINITNLKFSDLRNLNLPVPPLSIQQRIVAELDCISSILEKKRQQLKELDNLAQAIFYDMFGDPVENEKGWEVKKLGEECLEIRYGTSKPAVENGKYGYLRMGNLTSSGHLDLSDLKTIDIPDDEIEKCIVRKGDILFNRTNSLELIGKTCMFDLEEPMVIAGYIIRVRLKSTLHPRFVAVLFNLPSMKKTLRKMAKGAVNQANINSKELASIPIILPPLSLQQSFAAKIEAIEKQKERISQSIKEVQTLFDSRMEVYFG